MNPNIPTEGHDKLDANPAGFVAPAAPPAKVPGYEVREFIGKDPRVLNEGSPLKRVADIEVPVLLFHGDRDTNVPVRHSKKMHSALKRADKATERVIYEGTAHSISHDEYRIDMLVKMGEFLNRYLGNESQQVADGP